MKIKYDPKNQVLGFNKDNKFGKIQFQKGSLTNNKPNGVLDTDVIAGLATYIGAMDKQHPSLYNKLALGNLHSAFVLLSIRRDQSHVSQKGKDNNND